MSERYIHQWIGGRPIQRESNKVVRTEVHSHERDTETNTNGAQARKYDSR